MSIIITTFFVFLLIIVSGIVFFFRSVGSFSPATSKRDLERLRKEIEKWEKEGIIDHSQSEKIINRYLKFWEERQALRAQKRIIRIFSILGTILIGVGVILFIAANLRGASPWVYVLFLTLLMIGTYFGGWWLKYQKKTHILVGSTLIFLGTLLFGADLILISQIYHLRIEYSNLIFFWALLILPLAYLDKSSLILALSSILFCSWGLLSYRTIENIYHYWKEFHLPFSFYLSPLIILGLISPLTYKLKSIKVQTLNLTEILIWLGYFASINLFKESKNPIVEYSFFFLVIGFLIFVLGEFHSRKEKIRDFAPLYLFYGLFLIFLTSYILTFPQVYEKNVIFTTFLQVYEEEKILFISALFNFILFGEISAAIYYGIQKKREYFVNLSLLFFFLLVIARYFSLTWGLAERSVVFILGGIILLAMASFVEKLRKRFLEKIKTKP